MDQKPGLPPDQLKNFKGPWLETQLALSLTLGVSGVVLFSWARRRKPWKVFYAPRMFLVGQTTFNITDDGSLFGWVASLFQRDEWSVLQMIGMDAAVLLSFLKMSFYFFTACTLLALVGLVPVHYLVNQTSEGVPNDGNNITWSIAESAAHSDNAAYMGIDSLPMYYHVTHLVYAYIFSVLALWFLVRNYKRYLPMRQLFMMERSDSVPARTVMVSEIPEALQDDAKLAEYFESLTPCGVNDRVRVESVTIVRKVDSLSVMIKRRMDALLRLERAWTQFLGNPVNTTSDTDGFVGYDATQEELRIIKGGPPEPSFLLPMNRRRPVRGLFERVVHPHLPVPDSDDLLDTLAAEFRFYDAQVRLLRKRAHFKRSNMAFVTFENSLAAHTIAQVSHFPEPGQMLTEPAPDPSDIMWSQLTLSRTSLRLRQIFAYLCVILILSLWTFPIAYLAELLVWSNIEEVFPRLAAWIGKNAQLRALVQNSLPSIGVTAFNAALPFVLESITYVRGHKAKTWIESALLQNYHLCILFTTLFVFVTASTLSLLRDLSESPQRILEKLAKTLPQARHFFVSYVILSGIGLMPLQLLQLGDLVLRVWSRCFYASTPRDFAELYVPPVINLGLVYPHTILIFTVGITYSIIAPMILPCAAIYFGVAYLVFKYKLLYVFHRTFESHGQVWPLTFTRVAWGLVIFQLFMTGLFLVRQSFLAGLLMLPLIFGTVYFSYQTHQAYHRLSMYPNLRQASQVHSEGRHMAIQLVAESSAHGDFDGIMSAHRIASETAQDPVPPPVAPHASHSHDVDLSQEPADPDISLATVNSTGSVIHHSEDEGVYVVAKSDKTDYSQPPCSDTIPGILDTFYERYGHPVISGALPWPWLPVAQPTADHDGESRVLSGIDDDPEALSEYGPPGSVALEPSDTLLVRRYRGRQRASSDVTARV